MHFYFIQKILNFLRYLKYRPWVQAAQCCLHFQKILNVLRYLKYWPWVQAAQCCVCIFKRFWMFSGLLELYFIQKKFSLCCLLLIKVYYFENTWSLTINYVEMYVRCFLFTSGYTISRDNIRFGPLLGGNFSNWTSFNFNWIPLVYKVFLSLLASLGECCMQRSTILHKFYSFLSLLFSTNFGTYLLPQFFTRDSI